MKVDGAAVKVLGPPAALEAARVGLERARLEVARASSRHNSARRVFDGAGPVERAAAAAARSLEGRLAAAGRSLEDGERAVAEGEAELARLNRDYEVNKRNYDTLVQRLESARISESAEQSADNLKFRVIEPPIVPDKPGGPKRLEMNVMVLIAALGAG